MKHITTATAIAILMMSSCGEPKNYTIERHWINGEVDTVVSQLREYPYIQTSSGTSYITDGQGYVGPYNVVRIKVLRIDTLKK